MMANQPLSSGSTPAKAAAGSSGLQTGWIPAGLASYAVAVLLAVAAGWQAAQHGAWRLLQPPAGTPTETTAFKLQYPLWWHAPVYAGTGYGTEAVSYVSALLQSKRFRPQDVWLSHSGDVVMQVGEAANLL